MEGEQPTQASAPAGAVFLSYTSQDAEAAQRICAALRASGIEVWFDQSELRGGDAWDRSIRQQVHDCALFVPIISQHTHERLEGYFRLEWKLAVDRTHTMAEIKAFLVPVVIDGTTERDPAIPEKFRELQWTRLPGGETPPAFVERVQRLLSPETSTPTRAGAAPGAVTAIRGRAPASGWLKRLLPAALVVMILGAVTYLAIERPWISKPAASTAFAPPPHSVAVLPFVNMSADKEQEYFSDGLTEELLDLLSRVQDLRVPARTSSFYFKGKQVTIAEIAKALGVTHVLEGSVRKAGNMVRVTVQLIRADNGYHLWSNTYDRDMKDIFKVQDEIAGAVVEALKVKLASTQSASSHRSTNTEAYNQYLLGREFYARQNLDGWRRSVEAYGKAIALDSNYAAAYAGRALSVSWVVASETGDTAALKQGEADAEKAIALAPDEADGYASRGWLRSTFGWNWTGAQADFTKALSLDPTSATVQTDYGSLLESLGRLPEAIAAERKAIEVDPLSSRQWNHLGFYLMESRDYPAAGEAIRRALEIQPEADLGLNALGTLQLLEGKAEEALATFHKIDSEALRLYGVAMAEHTLGHAKESRQALDELVAKYAQDAADQIAEAFAWRGDKDKAFEWLERAYQQRDGGLASVKVDPLLESLRGDPRFKALLRKMNLPD